MIKQSAKTDDIAINRRLINLRRNVIAARVRWEKLIKEHSKKEVSTVGESDRSKKRTLYLVRSGMWWTEVRKEMLALKVKIKNAGYGDSKKRNEFWLPTVIKNPEKIKLRIYQATSTRNVTAQQARAFAKKAGGKIERNSESFGDVSYAIKSNTGRNYKLHATCKNGSHYYSFTEWAVCVCQSGKPLPSLKSSCFKPNPLPPKDTICTYNNSALYISKHGGQKK